MFSPNHPKLDALAEMDKYDKMPLPTRVQRFKVALSHSNQSKQSHGPFPATVTRKLLTSHPIGFAGYIIGLGDRHGSNILVDQLTSGALHIDLGDVGSLPQRTVQKMINSGPAIQRCPREVLFA